MARTRPGCVSILGMDPSGIGQREFWIEKDFLQGFYKRGWLDKWKAVYSVAEILKAPAVVFRDLQRQGQEWALCYAGIASHRYSKDGAELPPPPGMTFLVFVRADDVIIRWDWEPADKNLTYPMDYQNRFGAQIWPIL